jgi:alkaline phosphatase D
MMAMVDFTSGSPQDYSMEKWPGYMRDREGLVQFLAERKISNPVVLTGDIHSNWVNDVRVDDRKLETPVVATEFVGTSLASSGNGEDLPAKMQAVLAENPFVRFHNQQRGYVLCTLSPKSWRSDFRIVPYVDKLGGPVTTRATFVIEAGQPGAKRA